MTPEKKDPSDPDFTGTKPPLSSWAPGKVLLDEYRVESILGQGGMGMVYRVRRLSTGQDLAVKTILITQFANSESEQLLWRELRTWIDLPEHPNLTACRFFRTIENRLAIFAEYVDHGSIAGALKTGTLTDPAVIMDIAIQCAWGLHAAHRSGVIHQDVKPANILLTHDGIAKVTDFGLANFRGTPASTTDSDNQNDVSSHGMTLAYCSPEQAAGDRLTEKTDIWSWAVTVLEMFTGNRSWAIGALAPVAMEIIQAEAAAGGKPGIPAAVADVLKHCFEESPKSRWDSFMMAAEAMETAYAAICRSPYPREKPPITITPAAETHDRILEDGSSWDDPDTWLALLMDAAGMKTEEIDALKPQHKGSRKAQALSDLELYSLAETLFKELLDSGRDDLHSSYIRFLMKKALIHENTGDFPGALAVYDQGIAFGKQHLDLKSSDHHRESLAGLYGNKCYCFMTLRRYPEAHEMVNSAIAFRNTNYTQNNDPITGKLLAMDFSNLACILMTEEKWEDAGIAISRSQELLERLVSENPTAELLDELTRTYKNKSVILERTGQFRSSHAIFQKVLQTREKLVNQLNLKQFKHLLATDLTNLAVCNTRVHHLDESARLLDRAQAILEHEVTVEHRTELTHELVRTLEQKSNVLQGQRQYETALVTIKQALKLLDTMIQNDGRSDLIWRRDTCLRVKASLNLDLGHHTESMDDITTSLISLENQFSKTGYPHLKLELIQAFKTRIHIFHALDLIREATKDLSRAESLFSPEDKSIAMYNRQWLDLLALKGKLHGKTGEYSHALAAYDEILECLDSTAGDPEKPLIRAEQANCRGYRAMILGKQGRWQEARDEFQNVLPVLREEYARTGYFYLHEMALHIVKTLETF